MTFYRSDPINYYKLVLPRESAWEIMNKLGNFHFMQDKTKSFILYHQLHLFWIDPFTVKLNVVKMLFIGLIIFKHYLKIRQSICQEANFHIRPILKSTKCGLNFIKKAMLIQPLS